MTGLRWVHLDPDERDAFLGEGGTGVLSFGTDSGEPPVSIPVSYGYAAETGQFYFQLSLTKGAKLEHLEAPVSFVVHGTEGDRYRSVVATGHLERLAERPYDSVAVQAMWGVSIPRVDIFERPREEVDFDEYRLDPDEVTARIEVDA